MMTMTNNKRRFLSYELGLLTLKAALSTRDGEYPIYDKGSKTYQRSNAKRVIRDLLAEIETKYSQNNISEIEHVDFIAEVAANLSNKLTRYLHNGKFRVGVAQKLVNVHLKYLWTAGFCPEPLHCPIDGIIRDIAGIGYTWTQSDSIEEYKAAIADLKAIAGTKGQTLAQWELDTFRRREDEEL
jgi:hypothetical protein